MTPSEKDTDTLTRIDLTPDAQTHRIEPRAWAPLRVCPECSLAWEVSGEWCPSCGTAFDKQVRESSTATRVMPRRAAEPPLSRSARRAASMPPAQGPPRRAAAAPPPADRPRSGAKTVLTVLAVGLAVVAAFFAGQLSRPTDSEIDRSTNEAVQTARQSAAKSYRRAFDQMQQQAQTAIEAARAKGVAEGAANAQQQAQEQLDSSQGVFDRVTQCVLHGDC